MYTIPVVILYVEITTGNGLFISILPSGASTGMNEAKTW